LTALTVEVPASFVKRARTHLQQTGMPLVSAPRRKMDSAFLLHRNPASLRWMVMFDPCSIPILAEAFVEAVDDPRPEPGTLIMLKLVKYALVGLEGVPNRFECDGASLGGFDECDGVAMVSDALAVSCLSWVLRQRRTGFFVKLSGSR
jgi:hypothetical protein